MRRAAPRRGPTSPWNASTSSPRRTGACRGPGRRADSSAPRRNSPMLDSLPYELPELITRAPLDTHRSTVLPEWVDWNGHMNVAFYVTAFDQASGAFMRNMGLGRRYVDGKLGMTFVLETHVTYDREMREGAPILFPNQLLERDAKKVHLYHEMFHAERGYLAATNEVIVMNIDYASRRSAPWPAPVAERLGVLWVAHGALPRPAKAGRVMGLRKK